MLNVGVHFYVRQPAGLRVLSYVRQHGLGAPRSSSVKRWAASSSPVCDPSID
jgi:hypothetical protein